MLDHFNEPASRATRWALFALRRIEGTPRRELGRPLSFVLRQIEGNKEDHGATAATAEDTNCAQHQPTPLTEQAIAALPCEIILSLVVFLPSVFVLVLRV
jgi:hypothetical protein